MFIYTIIILGRASSVVPPPEAVEREALVADDERALHARMLVEVAEREIASVHRGLVVECSHS